MHIDATADSNKEGRPLVTVTSKDSFGHMFFVLRAFLPSEQSWAYKWLFQTMFPSLIGKDVLKEINIVVTDGDSQEITQLGCSSQVLSQCLQTPMLVAYNWLGLGKKRNCTSWRSFKEGKATPP